jgi:hypothetical protein
VRGSVEVSFCVSLYVVRRLCRCIHLPTLMITHAPVPFPFTDWSLFRLEKAAVAGHRGAMRRLREIKAGRWVPDGHGGIG